MSSLNKAIVSVLKVVDMVFPSLAHLWVFSYYMDDWNDATYHMGQAVGFSLESFNVAYEKDLHSDL